MLHVSLLRVRQARPKIAVDFHFPSGVQQRTMAWLAITSNPYCYGFRGDNCRIKF